MHKLYQHTRLIPEFSVHKPGLSPVNPSLSRGTLLQEQIRWIIWEIRNPLLMQEQETAHISPASLTQELQRGQKLPFF